MRNLFLDNVFLPPPSSPRGRAGLPNLLYSEAQLSGRRSLAPCLAQLGRNLGGQSRPSKPSPQLLLLLLLLQRHIWTTALWAGRSPLTR